MIGFHMELSILNWNVRGLNNPARRGVVKKMVEDSRCSIVCLQETKLANFTSGIIAETLGPAFKDSFCFKSASGTRGGILIACNQNFELIKSDHAP